MSDNIHVTPNNDTMEHVEIGMSCWCKPRRDEVEPNIIIHNAADNREVQEFWDEHISGEPVEQPNVNCEDPTCDNLVWRELTCDKCGLNFCNCHMESHLC